MKFYKYFSDFGQFLYIFRKFFNCTLDCYAPSEILVLTIDYSIIFSARLLNFVDNLFRNFNLHNKLTQFVKWFC